jgi:hypothetical protein
MSTDKNLVSDHISVNGTRVVMFELSCGVFEIATMQVTRPISISSAAPASLIRPIRTPFRSSHDTLHIMSASYFQERATPASQNGLSPATPSVGQTSRGTNALSSRITSVLSASYADLEIRDALEALDSRGIQNSTETRRQLRLDVQKEVIQCNGEIVKDFGAVAEVRWNINTKTAGLNVGSN